MQLEEADFRFFKLMERLFRFTQTGSNPGPVPSRELILQYAPGFGSDRDIMAKKYDFWVLAKRPKPTLSLPSKQALLDKRGSFGVE